MSESAVVGLRVTDLKGRMLYVNDTFPKIVGYPAKELIGQKPPYPYWAKNYVAELTAEASFRPLTIRKLKKHCPSLPVLKPSARTVRNFGLNCAFLRCLTMMGSPLAPLARSLT